MKKLFSTSVFCVIIANSFSQFIYMKTEKIAEMKDVTIAVALTNDNEVNKGIENYLASNWTASKYIVMKLSELESYTKKTPKNYVITYLKKNDKLVHSNKALNTGGAKDQIAQREDHLIFLENAGKPSKIKTTEALFKAFVDFDLETTDELAECIRELQQVNSILTFPGLNDKQLGIMKQITHYPSSDEKKITNKELWVTAADVEIDASKVEKVYSHRYKIVTKEQIAEAIKSKNNDVAYLSYVKVQSFVNMGGPKRPNQGLNVIQDAENGQILALLNGSETFDYRYFDYIEKTAQKAKK